MTRYDVAEIAGFVLLVGGIALWSVPAALVVAGIIVSTAAVLLDWTAKRGG